MILYGFAPERKKALENARFSGFSRALSTLRSMKLHIHLSCNFLSEVLLFLLNTFACLEAHEFGNCHLELRSQEPQP